MRIALLLAVLGTPPTVHVGGTAEGLVKQVRAQLPLELPEARLVDSPAGASLRFELDLADSQLWLREANLRRRLGTPSDPGSAVRVAVLVITRRVRAWPSPTDARILPRPDSPIPPPGRAVPSPAIVAALQPRWRVEAVGTALVTPGSGSKDLGASVAGHYRAFDRVFVGARGLALSMCCDTAEVSNVRLSGWLVGTFAEVGADFMFGPLTVEGALGLGLAQEQLRAQIVDLFVGPTASERTGGLTFAARAGLGGSVALGAHTGILVRLGALVRPGSVQVQLPAPYDAGRTPVGRRAVSPFAEAGLSVIF